MLRYASTDHNRPQIHGICVKDSWVFATNGRMVIGFKRDKKQYPKEGMMKAFEIDESLKAPTVDEILPSDFSAYDKFYLEDVVIDKVTMEYKTPCASINQSYKSNFGYNMNFILNAVQSFDAMCIDAVYLAKEPMTAPNMGLAMEISTNDHKLVSLIMPMRSE